MLKHQASFKKICGFAKLLLPLPVGVVIKVALELITTWGGS